MEPRTHRARRAGERPRRGRFFGPTWAVVIGVLPISFFAVGCSSAALFAAHSRQNPVDATIVPGCPTTPVGGLSECLARRVVWAAHLWDQRLTARFIVSGAATYNPFVEAEALAAGLVALGVPADVIWVEPHARHTDENMFYAVVIAETLGLKTIAVASEGGQVTGACAFIESWGHPCLRAPLDEAITDDRSEQVRGILERVRIEPLPLSRWLRVDAYEAERVARGGPDRPSSLSLYLWRAPLSRLFGDAWTPPPPPSERPRSYADYVGMP